MNVLIINIHSAQNSGDAALLEMAVKISRCAFPGAQISLAMNDTEPGAVADRLNGAPVVPSIAALCYRQTSRRGRWSVWRLMVTSILSLSFALVYRAFRRTMWTLQPWHSSLTAYASADAIVSCPGNILADTGRFGLPMIVSSWSIALCLLMGKRLYVLPQSLGPFRHWWSAHLVKALYSQAQVVMIREPLSYRLAQQIGLNASRLRLIPDLAFAYAPTPPDELSPLRTIIRHSDGPIVGVTVINRPLTLVDDAIWERYETAVAGALSAFQRKHGGTAVFFPQVIGPTRDEDDRVACNRIAARMRSSACCRVAPDALAPGELKWVYGRTQLFVATRMHSAIFATSMYVPTLMIAYMHKTTGLAELLQLDRWLLDMSTLDVDSLTAQLMALWEDRACVQQHLRTVLPPITGAAKAAPIMLAKHNESI